MVLGNIWDPSHYWILLGSHYQYAHWADQEIKWRSIHQWFRVDLGHSKTLDIAWTHIDSVQHKNIIRNICAHNRDRHIIGFWHNQLKIEERPYLGNVGTPQRDSLSPVLFIVYLETALRERERTSKKEANLPTEMAYANDVHFVSAGPDLSRFTRMGPRTYRGPAKRRFWAF